MYTFLKVWLLGRNFAVENVPLIYQRNCNFDTSQSGQRLENLFTYICHVLGQYLWFTKTQNLCACRCRSSNREKGTTEVVPAVISCSRYQWPIELNKQAIQKWSQWPTSLTSMSRRPPGNLAEHSPRDLPFQNR